MSAETEHTENVQVPPVDPQLPVTGRSITPDEQHDRNKEVAWYAALVNAYIATKMEVDRQLLSISIALLGAMVVALTQATLTAEWQVWLLGFSALLIFVSMASLIRALDLNGDHVAAVKDDLPEQAASKAELILLDKVARWSLYAGIALALGVAWQLGWSKAKHAEHDDVRRQETIEREQLGGDRRHPAGILDQRDRDSGACSARCAGRRFEGNAELGGDGPNVANGSNRAAPSAGPDRPCTTATASTGTD